MPVESKPASARIIQMGTKFIGEEGWVYVNRGKIDASNRDWLKSGFNPGKFKAYKSPGITHATSLKA